MRSGTRWKSRVAAEAAVAEPMSGLYQQMQTWKPLEALLANPSVVLSVEANQAQVLNRACFGRPILAASSPSLHSASSALHRSPRDLNLDHSGEAQRFQLGFEEAFFLAFELKCICIYQKIPQGSEVLSVEEVWKSMQSSKREFVQLYKAYAHFRAKQWVVRSGLQYGADFMAYCHHPALVHSDYAVVVMAEGQLQRLNTWTEVQAMSRLSGSVAKTLLLLHVIPERDGIDTSTPECLGDFAVEAVEVQRCSQRNTGGRVGILSLNIKREGGRQRRQDQGMVLHSDSGCNVLPKANEVLGSREQMCTPKHM